MTIIGGAIGLITKESARESIVYCALRPRFGSHRCRALSILLTSSKSARFDSDVIRLHMAEKHEPRSGFWHKSCCESCAAFPMPPNDVFSGQRLGSNGRK